MPRAKRAEVEAPEEETLDQVSEPTDNGPSEAELQVARAVAKKMGWTDQEDWVAAGRKPEKWVDAPDYLEETPQVIKRLQEQRDRAAAAAAEAIEEDRRQRRAELEQKLREAEDPEDRVKVARDLAQVSGPPPETQAWMRENTWFESDPHARAIAVQVVNDLASQGKGIRDQLNAATEAVRKRFPEHFGDVAPTRPNGAETEVRASQMEQRARPAAQPGSRAPVQQSSKEKGFSDLPFRVRQEFEARLGKYLKTPEQREKYAKAYWRDQEQTA